ncbi:MAG: hypothetical protein KAS04_04350, partial [Candidatus Aenigmarchaeota archaeon]|nr:hypothetical protein [Candidatus Aenigmarchaeota archaeon]
ALEIAEGEKKELKIYEKDMARINEELINQAFTKNELVRDNFRGAYSSVFFDEKSKDFEMVIGGYGGELYRDVKYKGMKTIDLLIQSQYTLRAIEKVFKKEELENYYANIKGKMRKFLKQDHDELDQLKAFKIYYFMKMMYWGGSRISMFNQYCYRYHPLLDYDLVPMVFTVPDSLQKNNKFNMKIIERFDEDMAKYMSSYGYNFEWEEKKITVVNKKITIFDKLRMLKRKLGIGVTKTEWKKMLKKPLLLPQIVELKKEIFEKETTLGSVYAIEKLLESINEKIIWEK